MATPSKPHRKQPSILDLFTSAATASSIDKSAKNFEISHVGQLDLPSENEEHSQDPFDLSNVNLESYSMATAQPVRTHRLPPIFELPKGKVFTTPYVPAEGQEPRRFIEPDEQNHVSQRRYRNMLESGIFELNQYKLPVCSNGRFWKPALFNALMTDHADQWTTYSSKKRQFGKVTSNVGTIPFLNSNYLSMISPTLPISLPLCFHIKLSPFLNTIFNLQFSSTSFHLSLGPSYSIFYCQFELISFHSGMLQP